MNIGDITFLNHMRGWEGGVVFCDLNEESIHINALPNKYIKNMRWYVENIVSVLIHETLHLVLQKLDGRETSWALHRIDSFQRCNISGYSELSENNE